MSLQSEPTPLKSHHSKPINLALRTVPLAFLLLTPVSIANEDDLEKRVSELEATIEVLLEEAERDQMPDLFTPLGKSQHGLGPAASKIYAKDEGVSIGGYGEFLLTDPAGGDRQFDAYRSILYAGFKFDEHWLFNSEIEIEHGSTGVVEEDDDGHTESVGSVSLEFGYVDYLHNDSFGARAGLLLVPVGITNELHEPITFLPANRPQTEKRIIPTTWRENGAGVFGSTESGFDWKAFVVNGLDGNSFSSSGLRGGRQKGAKANAEDFGVACRLDYSGTPGLTVGASIYHGDSGQSGPQDLTTTIAEVHAIYETGPWSMRALAAQATVDDVAAFNGGDAGVAEGMHGHYVEVGYDLFSELVPVEGQSLSPFVRYEGLDTQSELPSGQTKASDQDDTIMTVGLAYQPIDNIIIKMDYEDWDEGTDRFNLLLGYVF
ncbi:MAG: hypothetical protein ACI841_000192 [Planctomycetota bacterium]|jgi:hypothetical protein